MQNMCERQYDTIEIIGFWRPDDEYGYFSNWYPAEFDYAGRRFTSVEQYMMYQKVSMFGQHELANRILRCDDPSKCKKLGRTSIPGFNSNVWEKTCKRIVKRGVKAKFKQNGQLLIELLRTGNALLSECSPHDRKWGIGIGIDDPSWQHVQAWRGQNLLGRILMEVREELGCEMASSNSKSAGVNESYYQSIIPEWNMRAGELNRFPQYHDAIHAYSDTLTNRRVNDAFHHRFTLAQCEGFIESNAAESLPVAGFYEMKQDLYDTAKCLRYEVDRAKRVFGF